MAASPAATVKTNSAKPADEIAQKGRKRNQIDIDRQQHQFDRH